MYKVTIRVFLELDDGSYDDPLCKDYTLPFPPFVGLTLWIPTFDGGGDRVWVEVKRVDYDMGYDEIELWCELHDENDKYMKEALRVAEKEDDGWEYR